MRSPQSRQSDFSLVIGRLGERDRYLYSVFAADAEVAQNTKSKTKSG